MAMNIFWSDIYLNKAKLPNSTTPPVPFNTQHTFAHEFGHALGLDHHTDVNRLMNPSPGAVNGPTDPGDIGAKPICPADHTLWGVRCIYQWSIN